MIGEPWMKVLSWVRDLIEEARIWLVAKSRDWGLRPFFSWLRLFKIEMVFALSSLVRLLTLSGSKWFLRELKTFMNISHVAALSSFIADPGDLRSPYSLRYYGSLPMVLILTSVEFLLIFAPSLRSLLYVFLLVSCLFSPSSSVTTRF